VKRVLLSVKEPTGGEDMTECSDILTWPVAFNTDICKLGSFCIKPSWGREIPAPTGTLMLTNVFAEIAARAVRSKRERVEATCISFDWF